MDHYRVVLGISSPLLRNMADRPSPRPRNVASAKSSGLHVIIESIATQVPKIKLSARVPSAPTGTYPKSQCPPEYHRLTQVHTQNQMSTRVPSAPTGTYPKSNCPPEYHQLQQVHACWSRHVCRGEVLGGLNIPKNWIPCYIRMYLYFWNGKACRLMKPITGIAIAIINKCVMYQDSSIALLFY